MTTTEQDLQFRHRLEQEIGAWEQEGLISAEQRESILARYGPITASTTTGVRLGGLTLFLSVVGAIIIALAAFLFIAAFWSSLGTAGKILLVLAVPALALAGGVW